MYQRQSQVSLIRIKDFLTDGNSPILITFCFVRDFVFKRHCASKLDWSSNERNTQYQGLCPGTCVTPPTGGRGEEGEGVAAVAARVCVTSSVTSVTSVTRNFFPSPAARQETYLPIIGGWGVTQGVRALAVCFPTMYKPPQQAKGQEGVQQTTTSLLFVF